jgi:predicted Fe-S protein YdhL (DUF1289 family)
VSIVTQTICDGCGKIKQEANHWYILHTGMQEKQSMHMELLIHRRGDQSSSLDQEMERCDACGEACATELVSRYFVTGKLGKE